jgi:seryl-tRNA synthetase
MYVIISIILGFQSHLFAKVDTQALSIKVIELRKEVELLNDEYKTEREKVLSELKALSIQKAELASNIRNEEIRKKQLQDKLEKLKKEIGQTSIESEELEPVIEKTLVDLKAWMERSLPFKRKERIESIALLQERLSKKEVSPIRAANELWSLIEDEKRLARETSLHKQSLSINGKMYLAEVAKVGMLFLYFKTDSGQMGMAVRDADQWTYQFFKSENKQHQTLAFFESLKKQIRQGYFEIPTGI